MGFLQKPRELLTKQTVHDARYSSDGTKVAVSLETKDPANMEAKFFVVLLDVAFGKMLKKFSCSQRALSLHWLHDNETIVALKKSHKVIAWSPSRRYIASREPDKTLCIVDAETHQPRYRHRRPENIFCLGWSPDSKNIVVGGIHGEVLVGNAVPQENDTETWCVVQQGGSAMFEGCTGLQMELPYYSVRPLMHICGYEQVTTWFLLDVLLWVY